MRRLFSRVNRFRLIFAIFVILLAVVGNPLTRLRASGSVYQTSVLSDYPVDYWRLGETSGNKAFDIGRYGNTGTLKGQVMLGIPGALTNDPDTAMTFNGMNSYIEVEDPIGLNLNFNFTLEAWAKPSVVSGVTFQVVNRGDFNYRLGLNKNVWRGSIFFHGIAYNVVSISPATVNTWTYLALVRNGTTLTLYVNGASVATSTVPSGPSDMTTDVGFFIGRKSSSATDYFNGSIDEVAVYNIALAPDRILAHYDAAH